MQAVDSENVELSTPLMCKIFLFAWQLRPLSSSVPPYKQGYIGDVRMCLHIENTYMSLNLNTKGFGTVETSFGQKT